MARLEVYASTDKTLLLEVQADFLWAIATRLVVPLVPLDIAPPQGARLNPIFSIEGTRYLMLPQLMTAVPKSLLKDYVADLSAHRDEVVAALDMVLRGF